MQGLLQRLADLDSDAERGVRVIEFFDQLVVHGADLEAIVRASAVLSEATAGASNDLSGTTCVVRADGTVLESDEPPPDSLSREIRIDGVRVGRAWLNRSGVEREWDELIVDRMALTVAATYSRRVASEPVSDANQLGLSDPAIIQKLLDKGASELERSRAIRLLGFAAGQTVDVIAVSARGQIHEAVSNIRIDLQERLGRHAAATAIATRLGVVIVATGNAPIPRLDASVFACLAERIPIEAVAVSWSAARQGVRFAALGDPWPSTTRVNELGSLLLLAQIPSAEVVKNIDVQTLEEVAGRPGGDLDVRLLKALCTSESIRACANEVHMHHSSVTYRLTRLSQRFGFDLRSGVNRYRLSTALMLWGLHSPSGSPTTVRRSAENALDEP